MPVYVVTGKLGGGKTLMSVAKIKEYLSQGRKVATNLDLHLDKMFSPFVKKTEVYRLPDIPDIDSLKGLPLGYEGDKLDESKNGLLVLDECGIFFDSRGWNDKSRKPINAHFKLLRKLRWDAILIIQDIDNLDSDARRTIAEHVVYCKRTDRINVPLVGPLFKLAWGDRLPMPKVHIGTVRYGAESSAAKVDTWTAFGTSLYDCYETEQLISKTGDFNDYYGLTTMLPPYYTHGRYTSKFEVFKNGIKNFAFKGYHFFLIGAFAAAFAVNALVTFEPEMPQKGLFTCNDAYKKIYGSCSAEPVISKEYYEQNSQKDETEEVQKKQPIKQEQKQETTSVIYIAGWHLTTKGIQMNFADSTGEPYYPMSYKVKNLGECVADVVIDGVRQRITCMPDELAFQQNTSVNSDV